MTAAEWARLSSDAFNVALFSYIAAMLASFAYLAFRRDGLHTLATAIGIVGLVANGLSIVTRGIAADRTPWGNMYEYSSLLTFLIVLGYLWIVEARAKVRTIGGFVYAMAVLTLPNEGVLVIRAPARDRCSRDRLDPTMATPPSRTAGRAHRPKATQTGSPVWPRRGRQSLRGPAAPSRRRLRQSRAPSGSCRQSSQRSSSTPVAYERAPPQLQAEA